MGMNNHLRAVLEKELVCQHTFATSGEKRTKDILIVVHDQLEYTKKCLECVVAATKDYNLHIWNNGSSQETTDWLTEFCDKGVPEDVPVCLCHVPENMGFIEPNNQMAAGMKGDYLILLNSDTEVRTGWDEAMIGWLECNPKYGIVGYEGGLMASNAIGVGVGHGDDIDYVAGWCLCMSNTVYGALGLFDAKNLQFAYGEDTDLGLRVREAGLRSYALHLHYVLHHGNRTTNAVRQVRDLKPTFKANHAYLRRRWASYLEKDRVLLRFPDLEQEIVAALGQCPILTPGEPD